MHAISSYYGNRPTNIATNPQIGPITIHCAAKLSAQCYYDDDYRVNEDFKALCWLYELAKIVSHTAGWWLYITRRFFRIINIFVD